MLAVAAVTAIGAVAFVGASPATAGTTALCEVNESPCPAEVEHVHFVDSAAKLLTPVLNVICEALFLGNALGLVTNGPVLVHGNFTYSNCTNGCTVTDLIGGLLLFLRTAANLGEVNGDGFKVNVHCAGVIECEYDEEAPVGHLLGANLPTTAGHILIDEQELHRTGNPLTNLICPEPAELDANFDSLEDIYVTE